MRPIHSYIIYYYYNVLSQSTIFYRNDYYDLPDSNLPV